MCFTSIFKLTFKQTIFKIFQDSLCCVHISDVAVGHISLKRDIIHHKVLNKKKLI